MRSHLSFMPKKILSILTTRKSPTPTDTVIIKTDVSILGAFVASTCRSGSATVIAIPSIKLSRTISQSFLDFVIFAPMCVPICVIESSEPIVKRHIPTIIIAVPITNDKRSPFCTGTKNRHSMATIAAIGSTDATASCIFSFITLCCVIFSPLHSSVCKHFG